MKYEGPEFKTEEEIINILSRNDVPPQGRIKAVLSAIYYGKTIEFSGDVLIKEFSEAKYEERIFLKNLFETFYQMCNTTYRIDESIKLLSLYGKNRPNDKGETEYLIDELLGLKEINKYK